MQIAVLSARDSQLHANCIPKLVTVLSVYKLTEWFLPCTWVHVHLFLKTRSGGQEWLCIDKTLALSACLSSTENVFTLLMTARTLFVKVINTCKQSIRALPTFLLVPLRLVINPHEVLAERYFKKKMPHGVMHVLWNVSHYNVCNMELDFMVGCRVYESLATYVINPFTAFFCSNETQNLQ